jgi:hypothetical protein
MMSSPKLLFIEPAELASPSPVIDHITRRMCAAFRKARVSDYAYGGVHVCVCGAHSSSSDYHLPSGDLTNSLCGHYVSHHRSEVPPDQLARIEAFSFGELEPTEHELRGTRRVRQRPPEPEQYPEDIRQILKELDAQIEALNQAKEVAVAERDFEKAARLRAQTDPLKKQKNNVLQEWRRTRMSSGDGDPGRRAEKHTGPSTAPDESGA